MYFLTNRIDQLLGEEGSNRTMEDKSVAENATGEVSCEQRETTQIFLQIGHKITKEETSLFYVNNRANLQQEDEFRQVHGVDENDVNEDNDNQLREPITEVDLVVVNKISGGQESDDNEPKEDENSTVENLLSKIESIIDHRSSEHTEEPEYDKGKALEEDAPVVIEKEPVSIHMEHVVADDKSDEKDDEDASENDVSKVDESNEIITEAELVVVEKTPALEESEILVENESAEDEPKEDDSVTVEALLVNIESVIVHQPPKQTEEPTDEDKGKAFEEDVPMVIEKKPVSIQTEIALDQDEGNQGNEGDGTNSGEKDVSTEQIDEMNELISEGELLVVKKTPDTLESELLVEKESPEEDDNATVESLLVNVESAIDHQEYTHKPVEENKPEALEEDAPVVIDKGPISLHIEHEIDQDEENDEENSDVKEVGDEQGNEERETIVENELLVVEKTPAALELELLVEKESPEEDDNATVDSLLVDIESVIDHQEYTKKPVEDNKPEALEEDAPVVIDKGPISLHIEHEIDQDEGEKDEENSDVKEVGDEQGNEERETIVEDEVLVVEKTLAALELELLVEKESPEEDDNATVDSLLVNIESVIDHQEYTHKPVEENKPEALEEDAPVVIDKGPISLNIEHEIDPDEGEKDDENSDVKEVDDEQGNEERKTIVEDELLVVEKTPAALESELLVEKESPEEDDNATVDSLLVNIESVIDHQEYTQKPVEENKPEALEEDTPVVIDKGPISLHIEHAIDQDEGVDDEKNSETKEGGDEQVNGDREAVVEDEVLVVEKTPAALESELLVEKENPEHDNVTVDSLLVNLESVIDHQEHAQKPADENQPEALEEDAPVVIDKGPFSLHIEHIEEFPDQDEGEGQKNADEHQMDVEEVEGKLVAVTKTPAALETDLLIEKESPEDDNSTVESLLVNIESIIDDTVPVQSEQRDKAVEDTVQETLPPAVVRKPSDTRHELLQTVETGDHIPDDVSEEVELRDIAKDGDKVEETSKHIEVVTTEKEISTVTITTKQITHKIETSTEEAAGNPTPIVTVTTTEESLKTTSYTKLVHGDDSGDETELLVPVLRKRLSDPEVLPEREKDGSAPLALSEDERLDSKEHVMVEDVSQAKDATAKSTEVKREGVPLESEPYKDVPDEEKLVIEGDVEVTEKAEGSDRGKPLPVAEDEQGLLDVEEGEKADEKEVGKKGKKGLSSPQCKCCSLM